MIDEAFVNHLYTKTSLKINDLGRDEYQSFMARWEMNPKRLFNGQPEQPDFVFDAPIKAVRAWNRVRNYMMLFRSGNGVEPSLGTTQSTEPGCKGERRKP